MKAINLLKFFAMSILLFGVCFSARASHLAAADMHIDFVPNSSAGPYTYKITLNVYKACENGADLSEDATLNWASSCYPTPLNSPMGKPKIDTLDQLCDTFKSKNACRTGTSTAIDLLPAFVRHTWVLTVTLPGPCSDWTFWWFQGARNSAIKNLAGAGGYNLYVDAMINNSKKARVNTPRYVLEPIPYFCRNNKCSFPNSPQDPDLDSMVSTTLQPRTSGPFPYAYIPYAAGFSLSDPIASDPTYPFYTDPNTATATFQPTIKGKFVLAFKTFDYDKSTGELMGFTTRDVQVAVLDCVSPPPEADDKPSNTTGSYYDNFTKTLYACPGQNLRFDMGAESKGDFNSIYARWDLSSLPGATFTTAGDGTKYAKGTLSWTPSKSDVGFHTINLRFVDSTCSLSQALITGTYYVVNIIVLPAVDGGKDGVYCIPGGLPWEMRTKLEAGMRYKWTSIYGSSTAVPFMDDDTLARPKVRPEVYTSYQVEGSIYRGPYRCTTRDTVDVRIGVPLLKIDAGPDVTVCANKPLVLQGKIESLSDLDSLNWTPSATLDDSAKLQPTAIPYLTTNYVLYAQDNNGCGFTDTVKVTVDGYSPNLAPFASRDTICPQGSTQLYANVSQQVCGLAQTSCAGGTPSDMTVGTDLIGSLAPTPFYHTAGSAGERMQILYRRDELLEAGLKAGFINSMAFNIPAKNTSDSFYKFTIRLGCTSDAVLSGSSMNTYPTAVPVYGPQSQATRTGWNTFIFPIAYYWDGASNLVAEICWSKVQDEYGGTPDPVFATNTSFTSVKYIRDYALPAPAMGEGCMLNTGAPLLSSTRPNTRFNVCLPSSIFKYAWTPTSYLNQPDSANTNVDGLSEDRDYTITVTSATNPNCVSSGKVALKIDRTNSVTALPMSPVIQCRPGYFYDLRAQGNGPKPLRNLPCGPNNIVVCSGETTRTIANPGTRAPYGEATKHPFDGTQTTAHTQFIIPRSAMRTGNITSGTINSIEMDAVSASSMNFTNLKISVKCTNLSQFSGTAPITFETGTTPVFSAANYTLAAGFNKFVFTTPYNWDTTQNLLVDFCYAQATAGTGPTINSYNTQGFNLMMKSYQTTGDICANPTTEIGPAVYEVLPVFRINYCDAGDTEFVYHWTPGDYFQDSALQNPVVRIDETRRVYVETRGRNGCVVRDSVLIVIPENKRSVTGPVLACLNEGVQLRTYNGTKTKWYQSKGLTGGTYDKAESLSCDDCDRTIANPKEDMTYYAAVTDENGCLDTFRTSVEVKPLPNVRITNRDTTITYGRSITLNAFGGTQYYWTPVAGLTNANNATTTAQPLVSTMYYVTGTAPNGCMNKDSVKVTVDFRSPVSMPSAFSPNGDGKNDKFRIMGVTFQTLLEFRVFNRWGQEMFSTNNINDGWDGTFMGKPQDMGVYSYMVQVGYPDGTTQVVKGDVTLVR